MVGGPPGGRPCVSRGPEALAPRGKDYMVQLGGLVMALTLVVHPGGPGPRGGSRPRISGTVGARD